ncbi:MAG: UDP-N-acetylmuramoyl-L-alanyl-D-glutamate--2,6-diaminopimelate ligase [Myxococcota bacterium]
MKLSHLLDLLEAQGFQVDRSAIAAADAPSVRSVTRDSREVSDDTAFVAIVGGKTDGHDFVAGLTRGVAFVERPVEASIPVVRVDDTKRVLAHIAAELAGHPARDVKVVGVTGTNGKTTVTTLAEHALEHLGIRSGRIGTTGNAIAGVARSTSFTTPEAHLLQPLLAEMRDAGVEVALMEVSSIGLAQRRVDAVPFHLGVFTNLTRDHLDFHGTMEAYRDAKAVLFERLREPGGFPRALLCADDPEWRSLRPPADCWTYGFSPSDLHITRADMTMAGLVLDVDTPLGPAHVRSTLVGRHNALNLVAALGICLCCGVSLDAAVRALGAIEGAPGRLETVPNDRGLLVVVDYAHSDDALATVLPVVSELVEGDTWVVFGCGGDRDRGKRPRMGAVAERLADHVVLTSDNPRSEPPAAILAEIRSGMTADPAGTFEDRAQAIAWTLARAKPGDAVVIAGKGHETTQETAGVKRPFDDRQVARAALEAL